MRTIEAKPLIQAYLRAYQPAFLWGAPGVGKSDLVRAVAKESELALLDVRASLLDSVDFRGIPSVKDGMTHWNPPDFLPIVARDGEEGILFLDELNVAPVMVQAALYQLVLDRKIGEYVLPDGWRLLAAGNRQSDRAAAQRMPSALANRFAHIDIEPEIKAWTAWAVESGKVIPEIIAFLRFRDELLHKMDVQELRAFPSPRSWEKLSRVLSLTPDGSLHAPLAYSLVGEGAGAEYIAFLKVFKTLPRIDEIIANPKGADVPREPSARYAVVTALARYAKGDNWKAITQYLERLPVEFNIIGILDATTRDPGLKNTKAYTEWAVKNQNILK